MDTQRVTMPAGSRAGRAMRLGLRAEGWHCEHSAAPRISTAARRAAIGPAGERPGRGRPGSRRGQPRGRPCPSSCSLLACWEAWSQRSSAALPSPADGRRARRTPDRPPQGSCAASWRWPSPSCSRSASARSWRATRTSSPRSTTASPRPAIAAPSPAASPASRTTSGHRIISAQPAAGKPGQPRRSPHSVRHGPPRQPIGTGAHSGG